jgi:hypothetical protein
VKLTLGSVISTIILADLPSSPPQVTKAPPEFSKELPTQITNHANEVLISLLRDQKIELHEP